MSESTKQVKGKRTVLSDSLEFELNNRSVDSWHFIVRERSCDNDNCDCELICIDCSGHPLTRPDPQVPLRKTWYTEEVSRRKNIGDFAQSIIDELLKMDQKQ